MKAEDIQKIVEQTHEVSSEVFWTLLVVIMTGGLIPLLIKMLDGPRFRSFLGNALNGASWWQLYVSFVRDFNSRLDEFFGKRFFSLRSAAQTFRFSAFYTTLAFSGFTFLIITPPASKQIFSKSLPILDTVPQWAWVSTFLVASILAGFLLRLGIRRMARRWSQRHQTVSFDGVQFICAFVFQFLAWLAFTKDWKSCIGLGSGSSCVDAHFNFLWMLFASIAITGIFFSASLERTRTFVVTALGSSVGSLAAYGFGDVKAASFFLSLYLAPFANSLLDQISVAITRLYIGKLTQDFEIENLWRRLKFLAHHVFVDLAAAIALVVCGIYLIPLSWGFSNQGELFASSLESNAIAPMTLTAASAMIMVSSTLIPTTCHLSLASISAILFPIPLRRTVAAWCLSDENSKEIEYAEKFGVALYIATSIWITLSLFIGLYFLCQWVFGALVHFDMVGLVTKQMAAAYEAYFTKPLRGF